MTANVTEYLKAEHEADKAAAIEEAVSAVECPVANVENVTADTESSDAPAETVPTQQVEVASGGDVAVPDACPSCNCSAEKALLASAQESVANLTNLLDQAKSAQINMSKLVENAGGGNNHQVLTCHHTTAGEAGNTVDGVAAADGAPITDVI